MAYKKLMVGMLLMMVGSMAFGGAVIRIDGRARLAPFRVHESIFTDREYIIDDIPRGILKDSTFVQVPIEGWSGSVVSNGEMYVLTPIANNGGASQDKALIAQGFSLATELGEFQLFERAINRSRFWHKQVQAGDRLSFGKFVVPVGIGLISRADEPAPEPINIEVGRQMFLNDRLIASRTATRVWHKPIKYTGNPVLRPETELELGGIGKRNAMAAPFSGGVWYDGRDGLFKCWYHAGWADGEAYAYSKDGINWVRPKLNKDGGNLVFTTQGLADSSAVVLDPDAHDGWRWKAFIFDCGRSGGAGGVVRRSQDGIKWSEAVATAELGDRSTIFYNPFSGKWGFSIRRGIYGYGRARGYAEDADFLKVATTLAGRRRWLEDAFGGRDHNGEELYNFDCVAYESVMIGLAMIMNQPQNGYWSLKGLPKMTDLRFGFNATPEDPDGWQFPQKTINEGFFIEQTRDRTWDCGYLQSNAAICLVIGDELRFYYTGFAGDTTKKNTFQDNYISGIYANASMGFASLRRDGFCSMEAGELVTRRLTFSTGDRLWINCDAREGRIAVAAFAADGRKLGEKVIEGVNSTRYETFAIKAGEEFTLKFKISGQAKLYSFWTSNAFGRSGGYLAGGSPESKTLRDVESEK